VAVVMIVLCGFELYASTWVLEDAFFRNERSYSSGYRVGDQLLGAVPVRGVMATSRSTSSGTLLYDVVYSIDPNGLRKSPPVRSEPPRGCVAFFGCSFTYGEGLNDDETMPYRVGVNSGGEFRVYNFAFHGYGAQQMLAALEADRVSPAMECQPTHIVYQAIPDHVPRAAGIPGFSRHGPRYVLQGDGSVRRQGRYDDGDVPPTPFETELDYHLKKSFIFRWLASRTRAATDEDVRLWIGIVTQAKRLAEEKFGRVEFHVLLWKWDTQMDIYARMIEALRNAGIRYHLVGEILPDSDRNPAQYEIPLDRHPNATANDLIAKYVVSRILSTTGQEK